MLFQEHPKKTYKSESNLFVEELDIATKERLPTRQAAEAIMLAQEKDELCKEVILIQPRGLALIQNRCIHCYTSLVAGIGTSQTDEQSPTL